MLTALLQLRSRLRLRDGRGGGHRPRVVRVPRGSSRSTRAPTTGSRVGDVVIAAGGALAGRVTEVGPDSATVVLLTDAESTVIGQLVPNAATGEVVGQLGGVLVMHQIDAGETDRPRRRGRHRRHRARAAAIRSPYPEGPAHRPGRRRPARRERRRPDRVPPAGRRPRQARVRAGHHRLRGRPAADRAAAGRLQRAGGDPARRASSRASRPTAATPNGRRRSPDRRRSAGPGCYASPR